jgi:hypothetical protein
MKAMVQQIYPEFVIAHDRTLKKLNLYRHLTPYTALIVFILSIFTKEKL